MKTVVVGVFDRIEDAERVLVHLASSPLDLDTIQVVHAETDAQRRLAEIAGLPPRRSVRNGLVIGLLAGGCLGLVAALPAVAGGLPLLTDLGPLLSMAAGAIIGGLAGGAAGALSHNVRLPPDHAAAIVAALEGGATVIMVHTDNLPTARAIGELFRAGGSRAFEPGHPLAAADEADGDATAFGGTTLVPDDTLVADDAQAGGPEPGDEPATVPDEHLPYAPPWRRADGGDGLSDGEPTDGLETISDGAGSSPTADERVPMADGSDSGLASDNLEPIPDGADASPAADDLIRLGLSARVLRSLDQAGVRSASELAALAAEGDAALLALHGIGPSAVEEIRSCLARASETTFEIPDQVPAST